MLSLSAAILAAAVLLGAILATLHLRADGASRLPSWFLGPAGAMHGLLGAAGLAVLVLALQGPVRGAATGTASFGTIAAILLATAFAAGLGIALAHLRRARPPGALIGLHALLAISGVVILAAYILLN